MRVELDCDWGNADTEAANATSATVANLAEYAMLKGTEDLRKVYRQTERNNQSVVAHRGEETKGELGQFIGRSMMLSTITHVLIMITLKRTVCPVNETRVDMRNCPKVRLGLFQNWRSYLRIPSQIDRILRMILYCYCIQHLLWPFVDSIMPCTIFDLRNTTLWYYGKSSMIPAKSDIVRRTHCSC